MYISYYLRLSLLIFIYSSLSSRVNLETNLGLRRYFSIDYLIVLYSARVILFIAYSISYSVIIVILFSFSSIRYNRNLSLSILS